MSVSRSILSVCLSLSMMIECELNEDDYEEIKNVIRSSSSNNHRLVLHMAYDGPMISHKGMKKIARAIKKNKSLEELIIASMCHVCLSLSLSLSLPM